MKTCSSPPSGVHISIDAYYRHLSEVSGLAPGTCHAYCKYVRRFLIHIGLSESDCHRLKGLTLIQLEDYCFHLVDQYPQGASNHFTALRSFCRYLQFHGIINGDFRNAFLPLRRKQVRLKGYLSAAQVRHLIKPKHFKGQPGKRDRAIILLAAKLGLRAGEIARLTLDDIDWRSGTLCLRKTKGKRERLLPLPGEASKALIDYLRLPRDRERFREVFQYSKRPLPLTSSSVGNIAKKAFKQASLNVEHSGTHLLRHTLATHLVQKGADLKAVADLLGHRQLSTTTIYAKTNLPMLSQLVEQWPEEVA